MSDINIEGLDKAAVLAALYNASKPQGMGFLQYDPKPMTYEEACALLEQFTRTDHEGKKIIDFDYLKGRVMKVDLGGNILDATWFDRDNGEGAAEAAIKSLQETGNLNNPLIRKMHSDHTFLSAVSTESQLGQESTISQEGGVVTLNLGFGKEIAEVLGPKVREAKDAQKDT